MTLANYINDLLYRYDCVIVPDFGGFVRQFWADLVDFTVRRIQDFRFFLKTSNFEQPQLFRPGTDFDNFWSVDQLRARSLHLWPFPAHSQK